MPRFAKAEIANVYGPTPHAEPTRQHILAITVDNEAGALGRVIGLFSGRGYNIQSLTVGEIDATKNLSRITIVASGTEHIIEQIKHALARIIPVHTVTDLTLEGPHVARELALFKVVGKKDKRQEALRVAEVFRANIIDSTLESFIFECTGSTEKIDAFINLMTPLGLAEVSRTGVVAIARGKETP